MSELLAMLEAETSKTETVEVNGVAVELRAPHEVEVAATAMELLGTATEKGMGLAQVAGLTRLASYCVQHSVAEDVDEKQAYAMVQLSGGIGSDLSNAAYRLCGIPLVIGDDGETVLKTDEGTGAGEVPLE